MEVGGRDTLEVSGGKSYPRGRRACKEQDTLEVGLTIMKFLRFHGEGSLAEHAQELRDDSFCELMIKALWKYNYEPWMKAMLENTKCSSRGLELEW